VKLILHCDTQKVEQLLQSAISSAEESRKSKDSETMFAPQQQPTNKQIDTKRAVEKDRLEKCRNALLDLVLEGKISNVTSINDVFGILNDEIESRR